MADYYHDQWKKARLTEGASQRVQEDTLKFARIMEGLGVGLLDSIMTLIAFLPILWGLSKQIDMLPWIGEVNHALVWVAIISAIGGTILLAARRAIESLTLDRGALHLKDEIMPRYAELIYNGFWFAPEREMLQAAIDSSQQYVDGTVRLKLYKGNVIVLGRKSPNSLYDKDVVTFEADTVYDQRDAECFIKLNALRLKLAKNHT